MIQNQSALSCPDELEYILKILKDKFSGEETTPKADPEPQPVKEQQPKRLARVRRKVVKAQNVNLDDDVSVNSSNNKFEFSPQQQANSSYNAGGFDQSVNSSFDTRNNSGLNTSQSHNESKSTIQISKLMKVQDTEQLLQTLFSVAENLVQDYKLADHKLRKECLKNRQMEHQIYEQEQELVKLKHQNDEQLDIMMNFEQDYLKQKEDYQGALQEIDDLKRENRDLRDTIRGFNKEKQDIKEAMQEKIDFQKEQQSKVNQTLISFKDKIKNLNQEIVLHQRKIADLERENQNLSKVVVEQKHQNKMQQDEIHHLHHIEDSLKQRQAELLVYALPKAQQNQQSSIEQEMKESIVSCSQQSTGDFPVTIKVEEFPKKKKSRQTINNSIDLNMSIRSQNQARTNKNVRIELNRIDSMDDDFIQQSSLLQVQKLASKDQPRKSAALTGDYLNIEMQFTNKTLANELEMDVFEDFFSQNERSHLYLEDDDGSEISPRYSPNDRRLSMNDFLNPFSPKTVSNASSANRRRLVARVSKGYGDQKLDPRMLKNPQSFTQQLPKQKKKIAQTLRNADKSKQVKLSQQEFADYLQKKYGNKKGLNKYDNILDKKINLGDLKRRQTLVAEALKTTNTSDIAQQSDVSINVRDLDDATSPANKQALQIRNQMSNQSDEEYQKLIKLDKIMKQGAVILDYPDSDQLRIKGKVEVSATSQGQTEFSMF